MPREKNSSLDLSLDILFNSNSLMDNYRKAIRKGVKDHRSPELMVRSLIIFQQAGLFSGKSAIDNFKKAIALKCPAEIAEAMRLFINTLAPEIDIEANQVYFNHIRRHDCKWFTTHIAALAHLAGYFLIYDKRADWLNAAIAFKCLYYKTDLLDGVSARSNMDALLNPTIGYFASMLTDLEENTELLRGPFAQSNFNLLLQHPNPALLAEALSLAVKWIPFDDGAGLFDEALAQANFEALLSIKDLSEALPILNDIFDYDNELDAIEAQRQFDELLHPPAPPSDHVRSGSPFRMGLFPVPPSSSVTQEVPVPEIETCAAKI